MKWIDLLSKLLIRNNIILFLFYLFFGGLVHNVNKMELHTWIRQCKRMKCSGNAWIQLVSRWHCAKWKVTFPQTYFLVMFSVVVFTWDVKWETWETTEQHWAVHVSHPLGGVSFWQTTTVWGSSWAGDSSWAQLLHEHQAAHLDGLRGFLREDGCLKIRPVCAIPRWRLTSPAASLLVALFSLPPRLWIAR